MCGIRFSVNPSVLALSEAHRAFIPKGSSIQQPWGNKLLKSLRTEAIGGVVADFKNTVNP